MQKAISSQLSLRRLAQAIFIACLCLLSANCARETKAGFYAAAYAPPKDRTTWKAPLRAIFEDLDHPDMSEVLKYSRRASVKNNTAAMKQIFTSHGFPPPKGGLVMLVPNMGCFAVKADENYHRRLQKELRLTKISE